MAHEKKVHMLVGNRWAFCGKHPIQDQVTRSEVTCKNCQARMED
jgi:hypothetical protein